jgi:hypothetical protein
MQSSSKLNISFRFLMIVLSAYKTMQHADVVTSLAETERSSFAKAFEVFAPGK